MTLLCIIDCKIIAKPFRLHPKAETKALFADDAYSFLYIYFGYIPRLLRCTICIVCEKPYNFNSSDHLANNKN